MPQKTAENGQKYKVNGKTFEWTTEDGDTLAIPMRIKLKVLRGVSEKELDPAVMFDMLEKIAPGQSEVMDEMDVNDFVQCFTTWQQEYNKLQGATLGESAR